MKHSPFFPFHKQHDATDCGPSCLRMISEFHGQQISLTYLRERAFIGADGVSLLGISEAAEQIGMRTLSVVIPKEKLAEMLLPCIAHWHHNHFVVVYKVTDKHIYVADPGHGLIKYTPPEFFRGWLGDTQEQGVLLLMEPTPDFYSQTPASSTKPGGFRFLFSYLRVYKSTFAKILFLMLLTSALQMVLPFLTQAIVDKGIKEKNVSLIYLLLLGQFALFTGSVVSNFVRGRVMLHMGTRINIAIISDFLTKLMRLPIAFFNSKTIGDLLQRINDHYRIEIFLTADLLTILLSVVQIFTFSIVLWTYNTAVFLSFLFGTLVYGTWIFFFMEKRRQLDFKRFDQLSENQNTLIQFIRGMHEIKLYGDEQRKRWQWQEIQEKLFKINIESLTIDQYQQGGAVLITESKNILITLLVVLAVINNQMTLGMMIAIQYIIGTLNSPVVSILSFFRSSQEAKISFERLGEVHNRPEEDADKTLATYLPKDGSFYIKGLHFQYEGPQSPYVLQNLDLHIPIGKVTAVVGTSGSGKTTLIKLLLKFYQPIQGVIYIGDLPLAQMGHRFWRRQCGVVLQDSYIFSDTVAHNIALGSNEIDPEQLRLAIQMANIEEFVTCLPLGLETKIGAEGFGLSQGQKQRILIARAIYKDPQYLFFDEATNALDADNERIIMNNLESFYTKRTVVVVAHRLSTVQNADQIVVLDKGHIVELGTHQELTQLRGVYHHLVRNQLELGA